MTKAIRGAKAAILMLLGIPLLLSCTGADERLLQEHVLPSEISEYYLDCNFVNSFSSEPERITLANYLSRRELPARLRSDRLDKVHSRMKGIHARVHRLDSGMVAPWFGYPTLLARAELIEVEHAARRGDTIVVEVLVFALADSTNIRLIAEYEAHGENEGRLPSEEARLDMAHSAPPSQRIHKWVLTRDGWLKTAADIVLLDEK